MWGIVGFSLFFRELTDCGNGAGVTNTCHPVSDECLLLIVAATDNVAPHRFTFGILGGRICSSSEKFICRFSVRVSSALKLDSYCMSSYRWASSLGQTVFSSFSGYIPIGQGYVYTSSLQVFAVSFSDLSSAPSASRQQIFAAPPQDLSPSSPLPRCRTQLLLRCGTYPRSQWTLIH